ncbi:hypothetical protein DL89DRAFT_62205 [Linderina pennispora]|uniref:Copper transport protein n=1 Tax=Linderina pennispora TaxID=61395 RepID=A0A1Y1W0E1_9FUNG|nr:uncharacterized protein DL89DRAFT_62205 [Linderina pennispora]ORX66963.1 hypothetical protein DL89DRAFT_62205 [Linderina pennispora]
MASFALAYFFLIVLGIAERLLSLSIDLIQDKPGQPWRIFPRACIYFVVTLFRYVLMIAIMNVYIPMFCVICLGLTLGQISVEGIRYRAMMRRLKHQIGQGSIIDGFTQIKNPVEESTPFSVVPMSHTKDGCC